jgi:single stranded DNA-binding protein
MNYQKLILVGNVTRDPERRKSQDGQVSYTTFGVGVGDRKDRTTFFPVTVFGKPAEVVAEYVTKGRQVLVEGRIEVSITGRHNVVASSVQLGAKPAKTKANTKKAPKKKATKTK